MRRAWGVLLFAGLVALGGPRTAPAQPDRLRPEYWAGRNPGIPVNLAAVRQYHKDEGLPDPTHIQLYAGFNRGAFRPGPKVAVNDLKKLVDGKYGVVFDADRDGEYDFAVQFHYADGAVNPRTDELRADKRYVLDSVPPAVQLRAVSNGVEWVATDDNLDPSGVKLEARRVNTTEWVTVKDRAMRPRDNYAWRLQPGEELEVRVSAKDRAGNEGVSSIVRLPAGGGAARPDWVPPAGAGTAAQPRMQYVNSLAFEVESSIQKMGRSGIKALHLWVLKDQGGWAKESTKEVAIPGTAKDQTVLLPYKAERQGTYGFIVIPENGAGGKAPDPKPNDPAQVLVVVDTDKPAVKITGVNVRAGSGSPVVEINWTAADQNLVPNGINLEYEDARAPGAWKEIKYRTGNAPGTESGRYEWELKDPELWKFKVRITANDLAGNPAEHTWEKDVLVDPDQPAAGINGVRTGTTKPHAGPPAAQPPAKKNSRPATPPETGGKNDESKPLGPASPPSLPALPKDPGGS